MLEDSRERGVTLEGYSPLKGTDLGNPVLTGIARRHGVTPAQVVLRWHLEHGIAVIPKSAHPDRIAANFDVLGFSLTAGRGQPDRPPVPPLSPAWPPRRPWRSAGRVT